MRLVNLVIHTLVGQSANLMFENNFDSIERQKLAQVSASGARWFFWVAALSLITSIASLSGGHWAFFASLGITQLVDGVVVALVKDGASAARIFAFCIDALVAGLFALCGFLALKRQAWAFLGGIILFGLDMLVFLLGSDFLGLLFHGYVAYRMIRGFSALTRLVRLEREAAMQMPPAPDPTFGASAGATS